MNARERVFHDMVEWIAQVAQRGDIPKRVREAAAALNIRALVAQDSSEGSGEVVAATEDDRAAVMHAVDLLEQYAQFIAREVTYVDLERHPYRPEIEDVAERLERMLAKQPAQGEQEQRNTGDDARDAARYRWLRSEGFSFVDVAKLTPDTSDIGLDYAIDAAIAAQQRQGERT